MYIPPVHVFRIEPPLQGKVPYCDDHIFETSLLLDDSPRIKITQDFCEPTSLGLSVNAKKNHQETSTCIRSYTLYIKSFKEPSNLWGWTITNSWWFIKYSTLSIGWTKGCCSVYNIIMCVYLLASSPGFQCFNVPQFFSVACRTFEARNGPGHEAMYLSYVWGWGGRTGNVAIDLHFDYNDCGDGR